ncbi:MAG: Crp/Fnr family transcriptional regulator [Chloroflexi bacterium]|nr:Crp/Fnr family transcriptional regulator [Chloroflexota bacterium]
MTQDLLTEQVNALGHVPMFRVLAPEVRLVLAERMKRRTYAPGEFICHQGDPGNTLFIILRGMVKIAIATAAGSEMVVALVTGGQFFGEMSLLDGKPRSATAVALEPSLVALLTRDAFLACLRAYPEAAISLLEELSTRMRGTNHLISEITTHNLQLRLVHKLLDLAHSFGQRTDSGVVIGLRLRQQDLAEMVNASREQVNRTLRALQQEGLLRLEHQRITIVAPHELEARITAVD